MRLYGPATRVRFAWCSQDKLSPSYSWFSFSVLCSAIKRSNCARSGKRPAAHPFSRATGPVCPRFSPEMQTRGFCDRLLQELLTKCRWPMRSEPPTLILPVFIFDKTWCNRFYIKCQQEFSSFLGALFSTPEDPSEATRELVWRELDGKSPDSCQNLGPTGRQGSTLGGLAVEAAAVKCLNRRHLRNHILCKCSNHRWLRDPHRVHTGVSSGYLQGASGHTVPTTN